MATTKQIVLTLSVVFAGMMWRFNFGNRGLKLQDREHQQQDSEPLARIIKQTGEAIKALSNAHNHISKEDVVSAEGAEMAQGNQKLAKLFNSAQKHFAKRTRKDTVIANFSVFGDPDLDWSKDDEERWTREIQSYKKTHNNVCPKQWRPSRIWSRTIESWVNDKAQTYGIGCKHPEINCHCPRGYLEQCFYNAGPLAKFGRCKTSIWIWFGAGLFILCWCCCPIYFIWEKRRGRIDASGAPQVSTTTDYDAYPQDAQASGQQPS